MSRSIRLGTSLLIPALFLLAAGASAQDLVKESAPSEVSIRPDGSNYQVTTTNRRFETDVLAAASGGPDLYQLLLIEESRVFKDGPDTDADVLSAKVKVTVFPLGKEGKGAARFTIAANGDAVAADGPYLTVTTWGCCALGPTHAVYSLESGAYLFNATGDGDSGQWVTLGAKGGWGNERIIAYHAAGTEADDVVLKGAPNAAVVIAYATTTKPLQRILVTVPKQLLDNNAPIEDWLPKLDLVTKTQPKGTDRVFVERKGDPATLFTDVTMRLTLDAKTVIRIPLVGDKLKLDGAKLPKGFALVEVAP